MKKMQRFLSALLIISMVLTMLPVTAFAAHDSTGKPLDLTASVYLALYTAGDTFPGEPAEFPAANYRTVDGQFNVSDVGGSYVFASSAEGILKEQILADVVQGTEGVWGVFSTTGGSQYLLSDSGLVNEDGTHNAETEAKLIQAVKGTTVDASDYTVVWYIIKYQMSDAAWHIDGLIVEKEKFSVNYYGNGNTGGTAPGGTADLTEGDVYTVLGNPGGLVKIDSDTNAEYSFLGWSPYVDGVNPTTGETVIYQEGEQLHIEANVNLYAQWYLPSQYTVTVVTNLDGQPVNVENIHSEDVAGVYVSLDGQTYIQLPQIQTGTYSGTVTENGTYQVYFLHEDGTYESAHGHQVIIYNQNGRTELQNYSVSYELDGGTWAEGEDPGTEVYHAYTAVDATVNEPVREGYLFTGWLDQDGNAIAPGGSITESLGQKTVLTAQWVKKVNVTVNVTVQHSSGNGSAGVNGSDTRDDVAFQLLHTLDGVNVPVGSETVLTADGHTGYDYAVSDDGSTTTYTAQSYTYTGLEPGTYTVSISKSHYTAEITSETDPDTGDTVIHILYVFQPESFDMDFQVVMAEGTPQELYPTAVNVKVSCWGKDSSGQLGWHVIDPQEGDNPPTTVIIDPATGTGSGFYPVWKTWSGSDELYYYRVTVSSYVMPDGTIVPANGSEDTVYTGAIYTGTVTLEPEADGSTGAVPAYPDGSTTTLLGTYVDDSDNEQSGMPTVTVAVNAFDVTFHAGHDTAAINGQTEYVLSGQYQYPDLSQYVPESADSELYFQGWYLDEACTQPAENSNGQYLDGDVHYYAKWSHLMTVQGTVTVDGTYIQDGETVYINDVDRATEVMVVLQRLTDGVYNDVAAQLVELSAYEEHVATGQYAFEGLMLDDSTYRVEVLLLNYQAGYDNEADPGLDGVYTAEEYTAVLGGDSVAQVDVHIDMAPELYTQMLKVDATQIGEAFRPTGALSEVLYRDLGDTLPYDRIGQHDVPPYGVEMTLTDGVATGSYDVWRYHTNGTLYQYQMNVSKLYGTVPGVFDPEGTSYDSATAPYTIVYGPGAYYEATGDGQSAWLTATLVPNEYQVYFDLGLEEGETVKGMDGFLADAGEDVEYHYAHTHTWSYGDSLVVFPYRSGYIFTGWEVAEEDVGSVVVNNHGYVTVAPGLAKDVTLKATWQAVDENTVGYAVRYLKSGTTQVLHGAKVVECDSGTEVSAAEEASSMVIPGYEFDYAEPETMIVDGPVSDHVMTLYFKESGATEQVDSNLHMDKSATLEDNGTYTVWLETYTTDNPITTIIQQNTPLDIVMVLDQSGSIVGDGYLDELQASVKNFVTHIADHGRVNEVDHRIAIVGYAGDEDCDPTSTDTTSYPLAGGTTTEWVNTGLFDSNGVFHPYPVTGFVYTPYTGQLESTGTYYVRDVDGNYMLLSYHAEYRHLITEEEAKLAVMDGTTVYGYENGAFIALTRNLSGLWTYVDANGLTQLYSLPEFFTYHTDVWTHRNGLDIRKIHAYGTGENYACVDGHNELYTRTETTESTYDLGVYEDALVPVSVGANGSGGTNPGLIKSTQNLGSNGGTYTQYGIEMANRIFAANNSEEDQERVRVMVMFSDGMPGTGTFDETEANAAIAKAYTTKNTYGAYVYTIGLYQSTGVHAASDVAIFMNAVSSNYPGAQDMDDAFTEGSYVTVSSGTKLSEGGPYYVRSGNFWSGYTYYEIKYTEGTGWYYTNSSGGTTVLSTNYDVAASSSGRINNTRIYYNSGGYNATEYDGYYSTTESEADLMAYFDHIVDEITTKITQEIVLHEDTILRDIMGQGLVLTDDTVITVYTQDGTYNAETQSIDWAVNEDGSPVLSDPIATLALSSGSTESEEKAEISYTDDNGSQVTKEVSRITVYNWDSENPDNPAGANYHPHTVDITGYAFDDWYISDLHPQGKKMLVEITRIEALDTVEWGRSTQTNHETSGLWLPADEEGNRELLLPFDQPTTIFVERAYVLDYAKSFDLSGWYYDGKDESDTTTGAVHVDAQLSDGMNWFDATQPGTSAKTAFGSIAVDESGHVAYTPTKMNWGQYDQFYVFGDTWRNTVVAQDANENGNLWSKVSVIPASSVYYEDSFVTDTENDISGFTFTGKWSVVTGDGAVDENTEVPEHLEEAPYGDVQGWIDSMVDDTGFSDGSAHAAGLDGSVGASVKFTFTGTGVDVYTRTNIRSGRVMAMLYDLSSGKAVYKKAFIMDNLAISGDYYHIPTVSFMDLAYGTYEVRIIANKTTALSETGEKLTDPDTGEALYRSEYYVDGIRVYNPLGADQSTDTSPTRADSTVKDAYGKEFNSVFTEVRNILLDNNSFTADQTAGTGAVFIDWIQESQGTPGIATDTSSVGTYESLGPKNEVYLRPGQAVVIKVDLANTYYVGMKKLTADSEKTLTVSVSGITSADVPVTVPVGHTTDLSYQVTPDADGYIVIANDGTSQDILSLTKLRTANNHTFAGNGVEVVGAQEAVAVMARFSLRLLARDTQPKEEEPVIPDTPAEEEPSVSDTPAEEEPTVPKEEQTPDTPAEEETNTPDTPSEETEQNDAVAEALFGDVRAWLQA